MTTLLHIASSSNLQTSNTRQIGSLIIERLKAAQPGAKLIERDLAANPLPHISPAFIGALFSGKGDAQELALSNQLIEELLASDTIVIEVPMYNFGIPSALKAWIDHVLRAGKTFAYGATGPVGLVSGKKVILVIGRGGIYSEGPMKAMEFQETYMRSVLGFIGISDVESIVIEGVAMGPDKAAAALAGAKVQLNALSPKAA